MGALLRLASVSLVLLLLAGCGAGGDGDDDPSPDGPPPDVNIGGWYSIVSCQDGACGGPLTDSIDPPTHLFAEPVPDGHGGQIYIVRYCSGSTPADCYATPFYDFTTPVSGGWSAEGGSAFYSAGCTLVWQRATATLQGGQLLVRALEYSTNVDIAETDCTLAAAATLAEPCVGEIDVSAVPID